MHFFCTSEFLFWWGTEEVYENNASNASIRCFSCDVHVCVWKRFVCNKIYHDGWKKQTTRTSAISVSGSIAVNTYDIVTNGILSKCLFTKKPNNLYLHGSPLLTAFMSKVLSKHMFNPQQVHFSARVSIALVASPLPSQWFAVKNQSIEPWKTHIPTWQTHIHPCTGCILPTFAWFLW